MRIRNCTASFPGELPGSYILALRNQFQFIDADPGYWKEIVRIRVGIKSDPGKTSRIHNNAYDKQRISPDCRGSTILQKME